MPAPLPPELRERVVAHHKATGLGRIHLSRIFSLGSSTAYRWIKLEETTGSVEPKEWERRGAGPKIPDDKLDALRDLVDEKPDRTLKELCACWLERFGVSVYTATMHRTLARAKVTLKKKTKRVANRARADVLEAKDSFINAVVDIPDEQFVFIDEMGVNLAMTPTMARAPVGERAVGVVPTMRAANVSVAAAVRSDAVMAWTPHDGAVDGERFVTFVKEGVVPNLRAGDVVVMDNVKFHKAVEVTALIEEAGARVLFIPAYHPEFNAIEEAFSVVKSSVRRLEPRTIVELFDALTTSFARLTSAKLVAFVRHMRSLAMRGFAIPSG